MTAQDYLSQAQWIREKIADNKKTIELLEEAKTDLKATDYSKEPVKHSGANDASYTTIVHKIMDLQLEIQRESDKLVDVEREIRTKIRNVKDPNEQSLLYKRYILGMNFTGEGGIAEEMQHSERWIFRLHNRAVKNFEKNFGFCHKSA